MSANEHYNGVRFIYVRNGKKAKGKLGTISVAYRFNDEAKQVEYNTAECGKKDTFSRKVGRAVAMGRLTANKPSHPNKTVPYSQVAGPQGDPSYSSITAHLIHVHSNPRQSFQVFGAGITGRTSATGPQFDYARIARVNDARALYIADDNGDLI